MFCCCYQILICGGNKNPRTVKFGYMVDQCDGLHGTKQILCRFGFGFGFGSQSGQCAQVTRSLSRPPRASLALVPTYPTVCLTLYSLTGHVLSGIRITGDANLPTRMQSGSIGIRTLDPQLEVQSSNHFAIPHPPPGLFIKFLPFLGGFS